MNCRPNQCAWISVPASLSHSGVERLNGRIVQTVRLLPRNDMPMWEVTPPQVVTLETFSLDADKNRFQPGDRVEFTGIPDAWLRPFDPECEREVLVEALGEPIRVPELQP